MAGPGESTAPVPGRWAAVGWLWFCGFFNYADRQALASVLPLIGAEFDRSLAAQGMLGSAFMVVYALAAPLAGMLVDRLPRRPVIAAGLALWSAICVGTGFARSFPQLVVWRGLEGLGESFYFPASMSLLAEFHGPATRSRAIGLHQTSVYLGTAGGGVLAGFLGQRYGWRETFWILGLLGMAYAVVLSRLLREPPRGKAATKEVLDELVVADEPPAVARLATIGLLMAAFAGANFVAMALSIWLPTYLGRKFGLDLFGAAVLGTTFFPLASLAGAPIGGWLADRAARRLGGGRMLVQAAALAIGTPLVVAAGMAGRVEVILACLVGVGLCRGVYDANIFASAFDVTGPSRRGRVVGLMNLVGWAGGLLAPVTVGRLGDRLTLGPALAWTALPYLGAALAALAAGLIATIVLRRQETP